MFSFFLFCKGRRRQNFLFLLFYSLLVVRLRRAKSGTHDDLVRAMKMMNAWYTSEYDFLLLTYYYYYYYYYYYEDFYLFQFLLLKLPRPPPQKCKNVLIRHHKLWTTFSCEKNTHLNNFLRARSINFSNPSLNLTSK